MLVLTRRPEENIVIGGNIRVRVLGVQGNKVRLGIDAPSDVSVDREEVHKRRAEFVGIAHLPTAARDRAELVGERSGAAMNASPILQ